MPYPAVRVEGLGKRYRIGIDPSGRRSHRTLQEAFLHRLRAPLRNLTSLRRLDTAAGPDRDDLFWALRDVSFDIREGEALAVIGPNGAGKSTLLKLLSRITRPTLGRAEVRGRVGSLLEVGTGFHPELTGRENIYLNGSILGMDRAYIGSVFDAIVEFSGVAQFIDTPVKRYSSGMYLRLAFAVAAHLEPEVLIVDEVLAVGDAEFQRKCLGKMSDVAHEGRTILFVSHNMNAVQRLCTRCVVLKGGRMAADGPAPDVIARYLAESVLRSGTGTPAPTAWIDLSECARAGGGEARFDAVRYASDDASVENHPYSDGPLEFTLAIESDAARRVASLAVSLCDQHGTKLVNADTVALGHAVSLRAGRTLVSLRISALHLTPGKYIVGLWLADYLPMRVYDHVEAAFPIEVLDLQSPAFGREAHGLVACDFVAAEVEAVT